jgi:hypothetical protein
VDALDEPRDFDEDTGDERARGITTPWDSAVASLFACLSSRDDYSTLLQSMTKARIHAAEIFATRWAQHAVRSRQEGLMRSALLAASVRTPVPVGWDDATYPLAVVIRAMEVAGWDARHLAESLAELVDPPRATRFLEMLEYQSPILKVAGLTERDGPFGWEVL